MDEQLKGFRGPDFIQIRREDVERAVECMKEHIDLYDDLQTDERFVGARGRLSAALSAEPVCLSKTGESDSQQDLSIADEAQAAEPVVAGLEWEGRRLWWNGKQIGHIEFAMSDQIPDNFAARFLDDLLTNYTETEANAKSALETAALAWLSPVKQEPITVKDLNRHFLAQVNALTMGEMVLTSALRDLLIACQEADQAGELYETVTGDMMHAAQMALEGKTSDGCQISLQSPPSDKLRDDLWRWGQEVESKIRNDLAVEGWTAEEISNLVDVNPTIIRIRKILGEDTGQ